MRGVEHDEARRQPGSEEHTQNDPSIIAEALPCGNADEGKALDRLKAIGALGGMGVFDLADGSLLVTRMGMARAVPDARALAQLFAQMGVSA